MSSGFLRALPSKLRVVHIRKIKILIFSKMAQTILIKCCGFIVHSMPNNITLSAFPRKIPQTRKIVFLIFCPPPNVAPKPTSQSRSHSISRVPLQISIARFFVFDLASKLRVVHRRKNLKFSFSQKCLQRFSSNFLDLLYIRTPRIW